MKSGLQTVLSMLGVSLTAHQQVLAEETKERCNAEYKRLCEAIRLEFRCGMPVRKIANEFGISRQRVHTILKNGVIK